MTSSFANSKKGMKSLSPTHMNIHEHHRRKWALTNSVYYSAKSMVLNVAGIAFQQASVVGFKLHAQRSIYQTVDSVVEFGISTIRTNQRL